MPKSTCRNAYQNAGCARQYRPNFDYGYQTNRGYQPDYNDNSYYPEYSDGTRMGNMPYGYSRGSYDFGAGRYAAECYVVKRNETLRDVMDKFDMTLDEFFMYNQPNDVCLYPGCTLYVKAMEEDQYPGKPYGCRGRWGSNYQW